MEVVIPECCPGFWGSQCLPCPGGINNMCNGHGDCRDGYSGNGECQCNDGFTGVSCELCEDDNMYGPLCNQECGCVHGTCSNGPSGDGSCVCRPGYQGIYCDQEDNVCASLRCHPNAHCEFIPDSRDLTCTCNRGYEGDGRNCQEQLIHCGTNICHPHAFCSTPGNNCVCGRGYHGDGVECIPINHCQENNGNCPFQSSFCLNDGPGRSHCECRHGYENFQPGQGCTVIDMCSEPYTHDCPAHSDCVMEQPGITGCQCHSGYVTIGSGCYGNIMERLEELSSTGETGIQGELDTSLTLLRNGGLATLLSGHQFFTVMIPTDDAYLQSDKEQIVSQAHNESDFANYLMRLHILPTYLNSTALNQTTDVYTLTGLMAEITPSNKDYTTLRYRVEGSNNRGIITHKDLLAANGIIHIIDTLMYEPREIKSNTSASILDVISLEGRFNRLDSALRNTRLDSIINGPGPFTFFAPYNKAFNDLLDGSVDFLFSEQGMPKLRALLQNHIVEGERLRAQDLLNLPTNFQLTTQYNSALIIRAATNGRVFLNGQVNLTITDIHTGNGIIHVIDGLLLPPDIQPLLPHKCSTANHEIIPGICESCENKKALRCPSGSTPSNSSAVVRGCVYEAYIGGLILHEVGCSVDCTRTTWIEECCTGFYGETCLSCPGGFQTPCSGHGECNDKMAGNGRCVCEGNFTGTACELCAGNRFGEACDQNCTCVHGVCDNGPSGTGHCQPNTCALGYFGDDCEQHVNPCGPQEDPCHAHATCNDDGREIRCICNAGYDGDGLECWPVNVCEQPARGNCHQEAQCTYLESGLHRCDCNELWEGDGYQCVHIDPCTKEDHGGCHSNATCIFTSPGQNECECKHGFTGSGQYCDAIDFCSRRNGGCHPQAVCENLGPGQVRCRCERGYEGDGMVCYSNVAVELSTLASVSNFYSLIQRAKLERSLVSGPVTVFIPSNDAFQGLTDEQGDQVTASDAYIDLLVRKHFVSGLYSKEDLLNISDSQESWLDTWLEDHLLYISRCGETVCVDQARAHIEYSDIVASNGVIHIIDKVLFFIAEPPGYSSSSYDGGEHSHIPIGLPLPQAMAQYHNYQNFTRILSEYGVLDTLNQAEAYTLFMPGNGAIRAWDPSKMNLDLLKLHIILGHTLAASDLKDGLHLDSYLGHNYQLRFHITRSEENTQYYVNKVPIVTEEINTDKGVVYGLIDVINPVPNHCDFNRTSYIPSSCLACNFLADCPMGSIPMDHSSESNCQYTEELYGRKYQRDGCQTQCMMVDYVNSAMLPRFYGNDCEECPGGHVNPCNGHGTCRDGLNETGKCQCQTGFKGTACERCADGKYGKQCDQECQCMHGLCRDGMDGDGICRCNRGWAGQYCNISNDMGRACEPACDPNAYCVDGRCMCYNGYTGDGLACAELDACSTAQCSDYAHCTMHPNKSHSCECLIGYQGDGIICREENPCENGQSGCHENAECIHTGPALSVCSCLPGYEGDGRHICQQINACLYNNGGCDIRATCIATGPNQRECRCFENHVGDGFNCTGSIMQELLVIPEYSIFANLVYSDSQLRDLLAMRGPFTMFVPTNDAMQRVEQQQINNWQTSGEMIQILLYHIISCQALDSDMLMPDLYWNTLVGQRISVSITEAGYLRLNKAARIVDPDIQSTNGVIHGIDQLLIPTLTFRSAHTQTPSFEALARNGSYNIFLELLQKSGLDAEFNNPLNIPATLFVPSDTAFNLLPAEQLARLRDDDDIAILQEIMRYHFVPSMMLHVADFAASPGGQRFTTLQGSQLSIGCQPDQGGIYINDVSQIVDFERHFQEGLFFGVDSVLEPPSIGGRCDERNVRSTMTLCGSCSSEFWCPRGYIKQGGPVGGCTYWVSWFVEEDGCTQECVRMERIPRCCENHYGSDCRECPGGSRTPCSGHGTCLGGLDSDGQCECHEGFTGTACELCTEDRFGLDCMECQCGKHGICQDGRHGSGTCFCHSGWSGAFCDTPAKEQLICDPPCNSQNAVCREGNQCECYPQYYGNGYECSVIDQCAFNNGGCSPYASCTQEANGGNVTMVTCVCKTNYEGDGVVCRPIDKCQVENGGCHRMAKCTMTGPNTRTCRCNPPSIGNGINCEQRFERIPQCSIDNGGCPENAHCIEGHGPPRTPGRSDAQPDRSEHHSHRGFRRKRQGSLPSYQPVETIRTVHCECKKGYVGNGTLCNGNMLDTLASIPAFSAFYQALIQYAQYNNKLDGQKLLKALQTDYSSFTVFVPMGEEFNNESILHIEYSTVPYYIVDMMKIKRDDFYDNMTLTTWEESTDLKVELATDAYSQPEYTINGVNILFYDIPTTNGFIHVLQKPLNVKNKPDSSTMKGHPPSRILAFIILATVMVIILCIIVIIIIMYRARRRRKREEAELPITAMVSFSANTEDDGAVTVTLASKDQDEGGDETDMTDTEDGATGGMDSPDFVIGNLMDDTIAFADLDFTGASQV
ncbi:stabilin-2-like [Amphiura filiformis]|uniref:stabilin-2-like n=1 Tax=Amphiura filiformis TaxID=82378 RepID=UPI003B21E935